MQVSMRNFGFPAFTIGFVALAHPVAHCALITEPMADFGDRYALAAFRPRRPSQEQRAGILDVPLNAAFGRRLEGNRSWMISAADESQSFRQAPHGVAVYRCLVHFGTPLT
jgi:hypothetical protein